jgi:hypothetical protein
VLQNSEPTDDALSIEQSGNTASHFGSPDSPAVRGRGAVPPEVSYFFSNTSLATSAAVMAAGQPA